MMRFSKFLCGALMAGAMVAPAEACSVPDDYHSLLGPFDAIHHADWIGLAVAVRSSDGSGLELEFREYLKGDGPQSLPVSYPRFDSASSNGHSDEALVGNYYAHTTATFWDGRGRGGLGADCRIRVEFAEGASYLVFGPLQYVVGYENIAVADDDAWLEYVRDVLAGEVQELPPLRLRDLLDRSAAVIRVRARMDGEQVLLDEEVLVGELASYLNATTIYPEEFYRALLDPRCSGWGTQNEVIERFIVIEEIPARPVLMRQTSWCPPLRAMPLMEGPFRIFDSPFYVSMEASGMFATNAFSEFHVSEGRIGLRGPRVREMPDGTTPDTISVAEFLALLPVQD